MGLLGYCTGDNWEAVLNIGNGYKLGIVYLMLEIEDAIRNTSSTAMP